MTDNDRFDDLMDTRLRAAGERWRTANADEPAAAAPAGAVTEALQSSAPTRSRRRYALVVSAAVVAAALVVGGVLTLRDLGTDGDRTAAGGAASLVGQVWRLHDGKTPSDATLYVDRAGALVADDECTVIGAQATPRGGALHVTDMQIRHRDCVDQYGPRLGDGFAKLLRTNPSFSAGGKSLELGSYDFTAASGLPRPTLDVPTWDEARWTLVRIKDAAGDTVPLPAKRELRVHDGQLTTSDGCNGVTGTVTRSGNRVRFRSQPSTLIGCPSQATISSVLARTFTAKVDAAELTISKPGKGSLVYQWIPDDARATDLDRLVGPTWRLTTVAGEPAVGTTTLRFRNADRYDYSDACGAMNGGAELRPGFASLSQPGEMRCALRNLNVRAFLESGLWSIRDGALRISDANGPQSTALVFASGRSSEPAPTPVLTGTWTLTQLRQGDKTAAINPTRDATTFRFAGGRYTLRDACVERSGRYRAASGTVRLTEERIADHSCTMAQREHLGQADTLAQSIGADAVPCRVGDRTLTLRVKGVTLTFEKR